MTSQSPQFMGGTFVSTLVVASIMLLLFSPVIVEARKKKKTASFNVIDICWRQDPNWWSNRQVIAKCSVGYTGKMTDNIGSNVVKYLVTDQSDDPLNPKPGTLRYGATMIKEKVWVTFAKNMRIKLTKPLLVSSYTAIDGRGSIVHIQDGACITVQRARNVIIHGLRIHHCKTQSAGNVMGPEGKLVTLGPTDGDAIRLVTSYKVWIDHNTLYSGQDGLIDVTRGSTNITISNNWFKNHDKVMLLGHDDGFVRDKNMKVTVTYNHFGPDLRQRMPRVRHGFAHVVNNVYKGWGLYAIGGSMNPSVTSEANLFIAEKEGNKEVTWKKGYSGGNEWSIHSIKDVLENGASFAEVGDEKEVIRPIYEPDQQFKVVDARTLRDFTRSSGALKCKKKCRC